MTVQELIDKLESLPKEKDGKPLEVFMVEGFYDGQVKVRDAVVEHYVKDISMGREGWQVSLY